MPDIVFLDIRMPVMDGSQTLANLFERYGREAMRVVAVTASVFEHQRQRYLDLGFNGFLDKPLRIEQVYTCLTEQLGVTYTFAEAEDPTMPSEDKDWTNISPPSDLYDALVTAADQHSITQLRRHIRALRDLGDAFHPLASHLEARAEAFDIEGIVRALEQTRPAPGTENGPESD